MSYNVIPTGLVLPFAGKKDKVPNGWLLCDGSTKLRSDFPHLFEVIGTSHGAGDGSTTFHLPDYRGRILRGVDDGAGRDDDAATRTSANAGGEVGDEVGSVQDDQMQKIVGGVNAFGGPNAIFRSSPQTDGAITRGGTSAGSSTNGVNVQGYRFDFDSSNSPNARASATTDGETRMRNANVNYIVKV